MAVAIHSYIVDPGDGTIKVEHVFYGKTLAEAQTYFDEHLSHCKYMQSAERGDGEGELLEEIEDLDELPSPEDFEDVDDEDDEDDEEIGGGEEDEG